jgi:hypothetical protein
MKFMLGIFLMIIGFGIMTYILSQPHDNSDPHNGRSGLIIYTDNLTGCQYLSKSGGNITARLDVNSHQVGCK